MAQVTKTDQSASTKKLEGFTILEMIVTMIISTIIIILIYEVFLHIETNWSAFHKKQQHITSLILLKRTLEKDFENANYIQTSNEVNYELVSETDTINYVIDSNIVRIIGEIRDTFDVKLDRLNVQYVKFQDNKGIVKKIVFNINNPVEIKDAMFTKYYTSSELMNIN